MPEEARREEEKVSKRSFPSGITRVTEQRERRLHKYREQWQFLSDIPEAFEIRLIGHETLAGRPNYVLELTPRPGYVPKTRYGKVIPIGSG